MNAEVQTINSLMYLCDPVAIPLLFIIFAFFSEQKIDKRVSIIIIFGSIRSSDAT